MQRLRQTTSRRRVVCTGSCAMGSRHVCTEFASRLHVVHIMFAWSLHPVSMRAHTTSLAQRTNKLARLIRFDLWLKMTMCFRIRSHACTRADVVLSPHACTHGRASFAARMYTYGRATFATRSYSHSHTPMFGAVRVVTMPYGAWCMVYGVWRVVCGVWCMVYGVWCMVYAVCRMVYGVWCMPYGVWCMAYGVCRMTCAVHCCVNRSMLSDRE
jgi:hypothetical protein